MFREFQGKNHVNSKTKIVYAGVHILTYIKFFTKTLGKDFYGYGKQIKKNCPKVVEITIGASI